MHKMTAARDALPASQILQTLTTLMQLQTVLYYTATHIGTGWITCIWCA